MNGILKKLSPFAMGLFIVAIQLIGLLLASPFQTSNLRAFDNPESIFNPFYYIALVLAFTGFLLLIIRLGRRWILQVIMGVVIISTLYFVYSSLLVSIADIGWLIAVAATAMTAFLLFYYPEWYVIDLVGILI
ncbi:MAG: presenilin family intramembrane aspartyl protease, partial [Halobacteriota archaeon]